MAKTGHFSHFGGTKNGTSGARIKIPRPLLETKLAPKTPKKTPQEPISALEKWFLAILHILNILWSFLEGKTGVFLKPFSSHENFDRDFSNFLGHF